MSLQVWIPGTKDFSDQGLAGEKWTNNNVTINSSGKLGSCLSFAGNGSLLNNSSIFKNSLWSISSWLYTTTISQNQCFVCTRESLGAGVAIFFISGSLRVDCGSIDTSGQKTFNYTIPVNTWIHICVVHEESRVVAYINGQEIGTCNHVTDVNSYSSYTTIGASQVNNSSYGNNWNGKMNDIRIYDTALSPREVKEISKGLVLHYPLSMPGGENLLKNSLTNFPELWSGSGDGPTLTTQSGVSVPEWGCTDALRVYGMSGASNATCLLINNSSHGLTVPSTSVSGQKYTPSIYIKNNHQNAISIAFNSMATGQLINQGEIKKVILKATGDGDHYLQFTISASGVNKEYDFTFWHPKIELGEVCTPWIPATTDSLYSAMGFNDGIEYDVSGYGHNGTKTGAFAYDTDTPRYNTSTCFNQTDTRITPPIIFQSGVKISEISFSFWMKRNDYTDAKIHFIYNDICNIYTYSDYLLRISWKHDTESSSNINTSASSSAITTPNEWHHICYTFDKGYLRLYIDGEFKYYSDRTSTGQFMGVYNYGSIGYASGSYSSYGGCLSDFRIYATALSPEDVRDLYAVGASLSDTGVLFSSEVSEV